MKNKRILIAGGSGFLGESLQPYFKGLGYQIKVLTRNPKKKNDVFWDTRHIGDWIAEVEWATVLINLTGKSVDCRYNEKNKKEIIRSRVESTNVLAKAIQKAENPPNIWLNAASATIYVHSETQQMTEDEGVIGDDFSMNVCKKWEHAFLKHELKQTRRVALRASIVMGNSGGAFPMLKRLTKLLMGGKQGSGEQFISWIHVLDFCRGVEHIIAHPEIVGPVNLAAPNPIKNKDFMQLMRNKLKRSVGFGQSKWLLEFGAKLIGTETELLLKSRNVIPERLLEKGFTFNYPNIDEAIDNLIA